MPGNTATNAAVKCYGVMNKFHGSEHPMLIVLIIKNDNISELTNVMKHCNNIVITMAVRLNCYLYKA